MVGIAGEIENVIQSYLRDLSSEIKIEKAFLFGSYAKGDYDIDSDIDLAIFTDSFEEMDRIEGIKFLLKMARKYRGIDLQPIAFTSQDYKKPLGIVEDILKTGVELRINQTGS